MFASPGRPAVPSPVLELKGKVQGATYSRWLCYTRLIDGNLGTPNGCTWNEYAGNNWHRWDKDIEFARMSDPFREGSRFQLRPKGGPTVAISFLRTEPLRGYTDLTKFPLARMYGRGAALSPVGPCWCVNSASGTLATP